MGQQFQPSTDQPVRGMTQQEFQALRDAAHGLILFHNGLWGAPPCYMWAGPDGREAGRVPSWESEALDTLRSRQLATVRPGTSTTDLPVVATQAGRELVSSAAGSAQAA